MIVLLAQDLMMTAKAQQVAKSRGSRFLAVGSLTKLDEALQQNQVEYLLVDLQLPGLDLAGLLQIVPQHDAGETENPEARPSQVEVIDDPSQTNAVDHPKQSEAVDDSNRTETLPVVIGYAQHVHASLLSQARKMGLKRVVTRGQVMNGLEEVFAGL